ncbi:MAG TPA: ABC transporter ATP-binding protein [Phycisphaerales bacterium]|nr:ABC transporter ATP-binding protein [Phycisphaerales bacterium]
MATTITLNELTKTFPGSAPGSGGAPLTVVDRVSLRIEAGELFFLLGPSGCGKTTMLRMIAGFIEPTSGQILFQSAPPSGASPEGGGTRDVTFLPPNRRNTGMVFQSYALWPHMTVAQNVAFGLNIRKVESGERDRRVAEALRMVRMEQYGARKPNQLSGGQQQRVALARALVIRPDVLLLDEPLSNLDAKLRIELRGEIRRICKEAGATGDSGSSQARHGVSGYPGNGITTIYVTHDQKEALSIADRVAIVNGGKIVQMGSPVELYRRPRNAFVAEFLGETNFIPGTVVGTEGARTVVQTALGRLVSSAVSPEVNGDSVVCSVRPEAWRIGAPDGMNTVFGKVEESVYLGETAQLSVGAQGGVRVRVAALNPGAGTRAGESVTLGVAPEDVVVVAGGEG